jgi:hypothetical protein
MIGLSFFSYPYMICFGTFCAEVFAHRKKKRIPFHQQAPVHLEVKRLPAFRTFMGTGGVFTFSAQNSI